VFQPRMTGHVVARSMRLDGNWSALDQLNVEAH